MRQDATSGAYAIGILQEKGVSSRKVLAATVLLLMAAGLASGATPNPARLRYAPRQIIVKLRTPAQDDGNSTVYRGSLRLSQGMAPGRIRRVRALADRPTWSEGPRAADIPSRQRLQRRRQRAAAPGIRSVPGSVYCLQVDAQNEAEMETLLDALRQNDQVEYAERDAIISACVQPGDTVYSSQWALAKISASAAWDICKDVPDILVAVPDTGVDYGHRDLQGNLWLNQVELNGVPGIDDDGNGYIDDIRGYDFIAYDADPIDDNGHGTHCAGVIGARTDNGLDMAGVTWNATILPLKMLDEEGYGPISGAVEAIYYAVAAGAEVISCSWGDVEGSRALSDAVAYAAAQGVVLVAAAGNESSSVPHYPAVYPEVIAVAATNAADQRYRFSNFGEWVDIAAPGAGIVSLRAAGTWMGSPWDGYLTEASGTSMATPHIAGAAALLLCTDPSLTPAQVRQVLLDTVDPIDDGICLADGRLNMAAALQSIVPLRGELTFDRAAYAEGSDIAIRLADRHLASNTVATIRVATQSGDGEIVVLEEDRPDAGVFSTTIGIGAGATSENDGQVQAADGDWIIAEYLDADDGQGNVDQLVVSAAVADYTSPVVLDWQVEVRGASVRVTVASSEPTQAIARYGLAGQGDTWLVGAADDELMRRRRLNIGPLKAGWHYGLAVVLTDAAGNETLIEQDAAGAPFDVMVDPNAVLVPGMYARIQDAIDAAEPGQTVWVADGTYSGLGNRELNLAGKAISVRSENGPQACVINGRGRTYAFVFLSAEGPEVLIEGFTMTNCASVLGGVIQCFYSSPTIANCIFTDNTAAWYGGGIYCLGGAPVIRDSVFVGNSTDKRGGAVYCDSQSQVILERCTFRANVSEVGAAVAAADAGEMELRQCLFFDNVADSYGAAVASYGATTLSNVTISDNSADASAGGLWCSLGGSLNLTNCIVWGNTAGGDGNTLEAQQIVCESDDIEVNYSCVEGFSGALLGVGSFDLDPLFADPESRDFHLRSQGGRWSDDAGSWVVDDVTSPCIDAGDPTWPLGDEPAESPGENTRINLGAYGGTAEASRTPSE